MTFSRRKTIYLVLCTIFSIICMHCVSSITRKGGNFLSMGSYTIPMVSLQGVITAFNSLSLIVMVFIDFKRGSKISFALMTISITSALSPIFTKHSLAPLPGIVTLLVTFISIIIIYTFYKKSTINSFTDFITGLPNRRFYVREMDYRLNSKENFYLACIEI